ncbi:MAG: flagellar biosynthesis anti-sigma factor FlgM [Desulfovibrio sp.]|jgi:negative regulator of flagellin synthesis FlgM|nr:flagellar biosynthesis anti-sigma factor FlgM [Desulfovibrio sp.]
MKIHNTGSLFAAPYAPVQGKNAEMQPGISGERAEKLTLQGRDRVSVSRDALLMTEARLTAQNTPDVRTDKVEELRIRVANGAYKPDSRLIAENLLHEEADLFRF